MQYFLTIYFNYHFAPTIYRTTMICHSIKTYTSLSSHYTALFQVSSVCLVPPLVTFLAKSPLVDNYDLTSLTDISCGAAPLNPELQHTMEERLKIERDIVVQGEI